MGLYFRKSVRLGPLRLNFSRGGIGVSTGVPGFRIGTGPRGAYVHMGVGGLYYRQSLGGTSRRRRAVGGSAIPLAPEYTNAPERGLGTPEDIESGSALQMRDASSEGLLEEIQARRATRAIMPILLGGSLLALYILFAVGVRGWPLLLVCALAGGLCWWASGRDAVRRTVVIAYDLDEAATGRYEALTEAMAVLGKVGGLWHVPSEAQVQDRRYHAGASTVLSRTGVRPTTGQPPSIRSNLDFPTLKAGQQQLWFLPDRLLVYDGSHVGAISYGALSVDISTTRFIEDAQVPSDAQVVDHTWRYVNKNGSPDRRFSNNAQLPVAQYETMHLRSVSGLNELFHVSRIGTAAGIAAAVAGLAGVSNHRGITRDASVHQSTLHIPEFRKPRGIPTSEPSEENPDRLRTGRVAEIIQQRGEAWEHQLFAAAVTNVLKRPPSVPAPTMPLLFAGPQVAEWAAEQLRVPQQIFAAIEQLIETDLPRALGPPGAPGDADAILAVAWNIGRMAAGARVWAGAVRATSVPKQFVRLRDEIARTVDQPLRQIERFGPELSAALDRALRSPEGSPERRIDMNLRLNLENEGALNQAMREAFPG